MFLFLKSLADKSIGSAAAGAGRPSTLSLTGLAVRAPTAIPPAAWAMSESIERPGLNTLWPKALCQCVVGRRGKA